MASEQKLALFDVLCNALVPVHMSLGLRCNGYHVVAEHLMKPDIEKQRFEILFSDILFYVKTCLHM